MAATLAFDAGETVVQISAIEITIDHLLDIGPEGIGKSRRRDFTRNDNLNGRP